MSTSSRLGLVGAVIVVAVVLFIVLKNGSDNGSTTSTTAGKGGEAVVRVRNAKPVGGIQQITVTQPQPIKFKVDSDTAGDVHLHGYEIEKPVKKGGSVSFDVPSKLDGEFELELHIGGSETNAAQLANVTVNPS